MNRTVQDLVGRARGLHATLGTCHPKLSRGRVWCRKCGATQKVKSGECFRSGWPKCCGATMTIDSPEERRVDENHHHQYPV